MFSCPTRRHLIVSLANWQIGKFIGSYGYTAKGHQCQAACGRPMFVGGGLALYLVFPLFVFVGSVSIVPCTSYHHHHPHHRARGPGQTIVLPAVAGPACCVHQGGARLSHHVPLYSKAPPRVAAKPSVSAGASRASPFHLAVHAAFVVTRLVTAAPPSRSQSLRFRIHQRSARAILRMFRLVSSLERSCSCSCRSALSSSFGTRPSACWAGSMVNFSSALPILADM